jgi:hypothetical protein
MLNDKELLCLRCNASFLDGEVRRKLIGKDGTKVCCPFCKSTNLVDESAVYSKVNSRSLLDAPNEIVIQENI